MQTRGIKRDYNPKPQFHAVQELQKKRTIKPKRRQELAESIRYAALKMLNPSLESSSVKRHTLELSKANAAFLKSKYSLTGRFKLNNDFLDDFGVVKQRLCERGDLRKIQDDTFKVRIFKRKSIQYFVETSEESNVVEGASCLSIQFIINKSKEPNLKNAAFTTLETWTPLE
jgi:hypothetical protein